VRRVLIVCHGNICRSPMAEGYLRKLVEDSRLEGIAVASAGVGALEGNAACDEARAVARLHGFSIDNHWARQLTEADLAAADEVLVMDRFQRDSLRRHADRPDKVRLLAEFGPGAEVSVPDPYGRELDVYEEIYAQIEAAVDGYFRECILPIAEGNGEGR